jgi:hypothetical protein
MDRSPGGVSSFKYVIKFADTDKKRNNFNLRNKRNNKNMLFFQVFYTKGSVFIKKQQKINICFLLLGIEKVDF